MGQSRSLDLPRKPCKVGLALGKEALPPMTPLALDGAQDKGLERKGDPQEKNRLTPRLREDSGTCQPEEGAGGPWRALKPGRGAAVFLQRSSSALAKGDVSQQDAMSPAGQPGPRPPRKVLETAQPAPGGVLSQVCPERCEAHCPDHPPRQGVVGGHSRMPNLREKFASAQAGNKERGETLPFGEHQGSTESV